MTVIPRIHTYKHTSHGDLQLRVFESGTASPGAADERLTEQSPPRAHPGRTHPSVPNPSPPQPSSPHSPRSRSAILFFFGGGWLNGDIEQFRPQCEQFAERGMVAVAAHYRVRNIHGTTALESVLDGRSAVRWLRRHHSELGLDSARLCVSGGSAGGHVALCTALPDVPKEDGAEEVDSDGGEDQQPISCRPDALILFNPVLDTSEAGFGHERMGGFAHQLSPMHRIRPGMPPALLLHGQDDETIPFVTAKRFSAGMEAAGNPCRLVGYPGQRHGFFNPDRGGGAAYRQTLHEAASFLRDLDFLP